MDAERGKPSTQRPVPETKDAPPLSTGVLLDPDFDEMDSDLANLIETKNVADL